MENLLSLPTEMWLHVFQFLDDADVPACDQVCRQWHALLAPRKTAKWFMAVAKERAVRARIPSAMADIVLQALLRSSCEEAIWMAINNHCDTCHAGVPCFHATVVVSKAAAVPPSVRRTFAASMLQVRMRARSPRYPLTHGLPTPSCRTQRSSALRSLRAASGMSSCAHATATTTGARMQ